jgi:hypothetical protein
MKTKIFMTLLLIAGLMPAVAQNYYPDTVDDSFEKYYHYFDREQWLAGDTFVRCNAYIFGPAVYDSVRDAYIQTYKWDTVLFHVHHELWAGLHYALYLNGAQEQVYYNYTPRPIKVVGIAANGRVYDQDGQLSPNFPDSTEYLLFYDARPDTFVCRQRTVWDANDSVRLMRLHCRDTMRLCCRNSTDFYATEPFHESYFDHPILVKDSFYLGATAYSYDGYHVKYAAAYDPNATGNFLKIHSDGGGRSYVHDPNNPLSLPVDTCPEVRSMIKTRFQRELLPSEYEGMFTPYQWDYHSINVTPQIYPIFEEMCPVVSGLHVENRQGDEVTVTWNAHGSHTAWTVTYGPMGMPRDSFAVVACLQPSLTITGLDSTRIYDISVQAQCDYHVSDLEPFDADVLNNRDTTFFSEQGKHLYLRGGNLVAINDVTPDDGILLRPNPADRQVTVSATIPLLHVEVYDLAGRLVETRQPNSTTLQLDLKSYPSGTYLVKVTTATGTSTKKLMVR